MCLAPPPKPGRALELWIQHAAGKLLFERVRAAGLAHPDPALPKQTREVAAAAVDYAMYALMMLIEGVSGGLTGNGHEVRLKCVAQLLDEKGDVQYELDLRDGDGMCMGYAGWREGDFGNVPVLAKDASEP